MASDEVATDETTPKKGRKSLWYSWYRIGKGRLEDVVKKYGRRNLSFRDAYNYRNLKKDEVFKTLGWSGPLYPVYYDYLKEIVDDYISAIGKEKFKKCLDDPQMNIETLFDEKDFFVDCKDVFDFWNDSESIFPEKSGRQYYEETGDSRHYTYLEFEHYFMFLPNDLYNSPAPMEPPLGKGELFYVFRENVHYHDD